MQAAGYADDQRCAGRAAKREFHDFHSPSEPNLGRASAAKLQGLCQPVNDRVTSLLHPAEFGNIPHNINCIHANRDRYYRNVFFVTLRVWPNTHKWSNMLFRNVIFDSPICFPVCRVEGADASFFASESESQTAV